MPIKKFLTSIIFMIFLTSFTQAEDLKFTARYRLDLPRNPPSVEVREKRMDWDPARTALIVCDVWDYHHCLNAVRRLEEFAPRMNDLVKNARSKGVTIIHAPSDCMETYKDHPGRKRAMEAPKAAKYPDKIKSWCSRIPAEENGIYPIDQSDGGEDDDPKEHAEWAEKLKSLGRNPKLPWKAQSALMEIQNDRDFISDKGDEVWNILESRKIDNVILVGVHVNMCVLGRPFGLRQMVQNGKNALLVRDMTDAMYNPARWPMVDHLTGTDLIIAHIEKFVCPTITSDQFLGGKPFRYKNDKRPSSLQSSLPSPKQESNLSNADWQTVVLPLASNTIADGGNSNSQVGWFRANIHLGRDWITDPVTLSLTAPPKTSKAWLNGLALVSNPELQKSVFNIPLSAMGQDDDNLLVIRLEDRGMMGVPVLEGKNRLVMKGRWQGRLGDDPSWSNMVLPSKFGASTDIYFEPPIQ